MRDLDELLTGDVGRAAGDSAHTPDFSALAARGRRRATVRRTAIAGAAALAVVGAIGVTQLVGADDNAGEPGPVAPTQTDGADDAGQVDWTLPDAMAAEEAAGVIDDPAAVAVSAAVDPDNPDRRVVKWQVCDDPCQNLRSAYAVTDDGFGSRIELPDAEYGTARPAGEGVFVLDSFEPGEPPVLISAEGISTVQVAKDEAPLAEGEVLVPINGSGIPILSLVAVDPVTGAGHPVPLPTRNVQGWTQNGTALAVQDGMTLHTSDDGGETWADATIPNLDDGFARLIGSSDPETRAVLFGGDGSTYLSFEAAVRFRGAGAPGEFPQQGHPWAYWSDAHVLPNGQLLLVVAEWSNESEHAEGEQGTEVTPSGVYVSSDDWTGFGPVAGLREGESPLGSLATAPDGTPSLVVTAEGGTDLSWSTDGESWQTLSAR